MAEVGASGTAETVLITTVISGSTQPTVRLVLHSSAYCPLMFRT